MKKIILSFLVMLALVMGVDSVKADCMYNAVIDGESFCFTNIDDFTNKDGTAYFKDGNFYLDNYNGGAIELISNGATPLTINLIGNNIITSDNYGIGVDPVIYENLFAGDGSLTINAPYSIVELYNYKEPNNLECPICNNETPVEESNSLLENKYISITALSLDVIFLLLIVVLVLKK